MTKRFAVFDSDSHVVEPPEVWEKYLDPEYRTLGRHALWRQEGKTTSYLKINGETFRDTMNPNLPRHALWRPGMTWDDIGELDPKVRHPMIEGACDPKARLADMDAMGIDQSLLYPTWFAEGFHLVHDPDVAYALARAYNDWIADFCSAAPGRLFATAMVPLQNMCGAGPIFVEHEFARIFQRLVHFVIYTARFFVRRSSQGREDLAHARFHAGFGQQLGDDRELLTHGDSLPAIIVHAGAQSGARCGRKRTGLR